MSQSGNNEHKPLQSVSASMPVIALGGQIGCVTLVIVLAGAFGGIWLDNLLGTKPLLTILLVLGAAPLSLFLTYKMAVSAINKVNLPAPQDTNTGTLKEDETSE
ncbi:AtpZ/AtpI family protein [Chloroflexota bacterium]